jgi:hypothetical protein
VKRSLRSGLTSSALLLCALVPAASAQAQDAADHRDPAQPASVAQVAMDSVRYDTKVANNNLVGMTLSNYGFIGNNFISRAPSFEYPLGSNREHMVRAGWWIGAQAIDDQGAFTGVSTGAVDGSSGSASQAATEYSPASLNIRERSALANSPVYDKQSVSEEDFIGFFSDEPARRFSSENHRPLNLLLRQENYDWSFSDYAHFNIFHLVITNLGLPLRNVWVGLYGELASGTRDDYSMWPPASSSPAGSWFKKKWVQYDDSLRLFREHYCFNQPVPPAVPDACNLPHVPDWVGYSLLGAAQERDHGVLDVQPGQRAARPGRRALRDHELGPDPGSDGSRFPALHGRSRPIARSRAVRGARSG